MMRHGNRANALSICTFVRIHYTHNHNRQIQRVAHRKYIISLQVAHTVTEHWRTEVGVSSRNAEERIYGKEEDEYLGDKREMMVDEATLLACVEGWPCSFVD